MILGANISKDLRIHIFHQLPNFLTYSPRITVFESGCRNILGAMDN